MADSADHHHFQVDLRGIIDILANHLYSTPNVFVRELLQNGCDAIQMRRNEGEFDHPGKIALEIIAGSPDDPESRPTLVCSDDGIGLTQDEVHRFLATVGRSSKRDELFHASSDFIGQFGIGLLSCFTVSEEITLITKSAREPDAPACKWTANANGTYQIDLLDRDISPGATIYLRSRPGLDHLFSREKVEELARHWGRLLPYEISITGGFTPEGKPAETTIISYKDHPLASNRYNRGEASDFAAEMFPEEPTFFDVIPLKSDIGGVTGLACILGRPSPQARSQKHRVYLKGMLLAEGNESVLPEWAFFVRGIINAQSLRPTASREDFYDDTTLESVRENLGTALKEYLLELSQSNPDKLRNLINLHWLSFKALAVEDDEFFNTVINWLPFQTTLGQLTLPGIAENSPPPIQYAKNDDEYRQIAGVAGAQGLCVVNGSYVYDTELLERIDSLTDHSTAKLDPQDITHSFDDLTESEQDAVFEFIKIADRVLQPFKCTAEVRRFLPEEVPVFFVSNEAANFLKSVEQSREGKGDEMLGSILDTLSEDAITQAYTSVCFNFAHPQIQRLTLLDDREVITSAVKMLYVQALLLGQQPFTKRELDLLTNGIGQFIEWGISQSQSTSE